MRALIALFELFFLHFPSANAAHPTDFDTSMEVIAFGSCNRQNLPQLMWPVIASNQPDLWIWAGDNVYGDSKDIEVVAEAYAKLMANPAYQEFHSNTPMLATWDDHDYGWNNAGKDYPIKALTRDLALNFTGVPTEDPRRAREGLYGAYDFGPEGQRIKVVLLDARYFATGKKAEEPELIGKAQQAWLTKELENSTAQIHIIVSGIQIISEEHNWESWAQYPDDREWLLNLIDETNTPGVLFISGDRHIHELSVLRDPRFEYPLLDATSSGLTHSWESFKGEPNKHRIGEVYKGLGFGLIELDWSETSCDISVEIRDIENNTINQFKLDLALK